MKPLLLLLAALCSTVVFGQLNDPVTIKDFDFTGNVKSATESTYEGEEKFGEPVKTTLSSKSGYTFNRAGLRTENSTQAFGSDKWKVSMKSKYNSNNDIVEEEADDDGEVTIAKITYNSDKTLKQVDLTDKKGRLKEKHIFQYEPVDYNLTDINEFMNTQYTLHFRRIYNGNGKLIAIHRFNRSQIGLHIYEIYDTNDKMQSREKRLKDFDGTLKELVKETDDNKVEETYTYNDAKQLIKSTYQRNKGKMSFTDYEYNNKGFVSKKSDSYGITYEYSYTYDKKNNWIKKIEKKTVGKHVSYEITERSIEYY